MARIRNRITKADFYTDPELLGWPRDKREFYRRTWAMAEDSGCLEDSPFGWKLLMYPSPLDDDVTPDLLAAWRDELMEAGKLIPYTVNGSAKQYLFITNFHEHEHPRNPQKPDVPLPPWVRYEAATMKTAAGSTTTRHQYSVDTDAVQKLKQHGKQMPNQEQAQNSDGTGGLQRPQSSPVQSSPVPKRARAREDAVETVDKSVDGRRPSGRKKKPEPLPDVPDAITGPVAKIVGAAQLPQLLEEGSDLNVQCRRLLQLVDQLAQSFIGPGVTVAQRDQARLLTFRTLAKTHQKKPIQNLPAYIATMLKNDWHLGDLVGDRWLEAQRHPARAKTPGEPQAISDVLKGTVA